MTGPYIIETHRLLPSAEDSSAMEYTSRIAVGTLEEEELSIELFNWRIGDQLSRREVELLHAIADAADNGQGHTPDGRTITVKPTTWETLAGATALAADAADLPPRGQDQILAAWNRAQNMETSDAP